MPSITSISLLFAQAAPASEPWYEQPAFTVVLALLVIIVPFLLGKMFAKKLRMNDDAWRIGLVLFSVIAGVAICCLGWPPRLGIDLSGGVNLVYEVDPTKSGDNVGTVEERVRERLKNVEGLNATVSRTEGDKIEVTFPEDNAKLTRRVEDEISRIDLGKIGVSVVLETSAPTNGKHLLRYRTQQDKKLANEEMDKLVGSIGKRINPGGQKEVTVRSAGGDRIEVMIPRVEPGEIDVIKEKISTAGALKFRVTANPRAPKHRNIVEVGRQTESRFIKDGSGKIIAEWLPIDLQSAGKAETLSGHVEMRTNKKGETEALIINDDFDVNGGELSQASSNYDEKGRPCVEFSFKPAGAALFGELTSLNLPDTTGGVEYGIGIILDDKLKSAPTIIQRISSQGRITGNFTDSDVKFLVDILNAGSLPAALSKVPVAQQNLSAQLGQDTIKAGAYAMGISTLAILVFMIVYYRFAGFVADLAVLLNVVLVMALLILIKAHLTLAGVAGLVLSVGMSVDANVLIYERMREEMERGAALRMAIRNGFSRAMSTIIDSNLTTLIVGVVLYIIGTDQLRGFATTLILGLILNLFTAVYCARLVFDIAERHRWITDLKMLKLFGRPNFDFVKMATPAIVGSALIIVAGLVAAYIRGEGLYGIDFTGGTSVQVVFKDPIDIGEVRKAVSNAPPEDFPDATVSSIVSGEQSERDKQFSIATSNSNIKDVEAKLQALFPGKLKTHSMKYEIAAAAPVSAAPVDEKSDKEKSDKTKAESGKTSSIREAAGMIASAAPEAMLLAQAEKADSKTGKSAPKADANKKTEADTTKPAKPDEKKVTPSTDPAKTTQPTAGKDKTEAAAVEEQLTTAKLTFPDGISQEALDAKLRDGAKQLQFDDTFQIDPTTDTDFTAGSSRAIMDWTVKTSLAPAQVETLLKSVQEKFTDDPVFPSANNIGGKVAGDTKVMAGYALFMSNLIIIYVWVRFQNLVFGVAAVVALIHDVFVAFAALALSFWLAPYLGFLQVDQFKISLDVVAALLTIVGFSINDTIVIFDRIREVRGKSPDLSAGIVNRALNETLSRTVLTSGTVFIVTIILYAAGGEGIHPFAFTMLIGVIAGTYSSIFIAAPLALWMQKKSVQVSRKVPAGAVTASGAR